MKRAIATIVVPFVVFLFLPADLLGLAEDRQLAMYLCPIFLHEVDFLGVHLDDLGKLQFGQGRLLHGLLVIPAYEEIVQLLCL